MKNIKRMSAFVLAVVMVLSLVSISPATTVEAASKASVTITAPTAKSTYTVTRAAKNKTFTIKYKVSNGTKKSVAFKSSNTKVATVSKKGKVTVKSAGTAKITVTVTLKNGKKVKDTLKLTVKQQATGLSATLKDAYKVSGSWIIPVGTKKKLTPVFTPSTTTNQSVTYTSNKTSVATVNKKGQVTAKKVGTATITIKAQDGSKKTTKVKIKVVNPVKSVTLSPNGSQTLYVGDTLATKVTFKLSKKTNTVQKVAYTSSDESVATVNSSGVITAKAAGTAKITATAKDGSGKKDTIKLTVKEKEVATTEAPTTEEPAEPAAEVTKTVITVNEGASVSASIKSGNIEAILTALETAAKKYSADLSSLEDKTLTITVNKNTYTVMYSGGEITYGDDAGTSSDDVKSKIVSSTKDATATITIPSSTGIEAVLTAAANLQKEEATSSLSVTLSYNGVEYTLSDVEVKDNEYKFTLNKDVYYAKVSGDKIYVKGDVRSNGAFSILVFDEVIKMTPSTEAY